MTAEQVREHLRKQPRWSVTDDGKSITRTYSYSSFRAGLAFVAFVGELAEDADHHPDIDIRFSKVTLTLSTHSAGELTDRDFALAALIDGLG